MELEINNHVFKKRYFYNYQAHSFNLISISPYNDDLFYTASEDNTIRMWDLRV